MRGTRGTRRGGRGRPGGRRRRHGGGRPGRRRRRGGRAGRRGRRRRRAGRSRRARGRSWGSRARPRRGRRPVAVAVAVAVVTMPLATAAVSNSPAAPSAGLEMGQGDAVDRQPRLGVEHDRARGDLADGPGVGRIHLRCVVQIRPGSRVTGCRPRGGTRQTVQQAGAPPGQQACTAQQRRTQRGAGEGASGGLGLERVASSRGASVGDSLSSGADAARGGVLRWCVGTQERVERVSGRRGFDVMAIRAARER